MRWLFLVVLAACGSGGGKTTLRLESPQFDEHRAELVRASNAGDVAAIRRYLRDSVVVGGLWFDDVSCLREFSVPGVVGGPRLDELARCLTTIKLSLSERVDALPDVAVLTYVPGIEIEARIVERRDGPVLAWIGYVARRNVHDAIPTVTAGTLETARLEGDQQAIVAGPLLAGDIAKGGSGYAWLKVCIDATGAVTGAHVREASSPAAARAFIEGIKSWKFQPVVLRGQATPVCAMERLVYPADKAPPHEQLPLPIPEEPEDVTNVPSKVLTRLSGQTGISPGGDVMTEMLRIGLMRVVGAYQYCIDASGHVDRVNMIRSTGIASYDQRIMRAIGAWTYVPYLDEGKAVPVCSSVNFIFNVR